MDKKPDLVVSGINEGHNLGRIIYVSGTFNAAQEAVLNGVPGIALSLDRNKKALDYTIGAEFARELVTQLRQKGFPHNAVINVNIPNCTREELKGVLLTTLSEYQYREIWSKRKTPWGQTYFWQMVRGPMKPGDVGSDQWAVENNYISVNPVPIDIENRASMQFLKNAKLKFQGRDMIKSVRDVK
jgi:5'-nucleotidase